MKFINTVTGAVVAVSLLAVPAAFAAATAKQVNPHELMQACDMNHDGTMTKAELLSHMDKMFDRVDVAKLGKLDAMQTDQFLRNITLDHN